MKKYFFKKGFTLIELLIVVAIIGILATLLMVNFVGVRQRARDAQRKSDLRQMEAALELYRSDVGSYPLPSGNYWLNPSSCPATSSFINSSTEIVYMETLPCEPAGTTAYNNGNYYYDSDGVTYTLAACMENGNDSQVTGWTSSFPNASGCAAGYYYILNNP